jgi:hypothetical protein
MLPIATWLHLLWSIVQLLFRLALKRLLRIATSLCEIQRICYGTEKGAERTLQVEQSLQRSRSKVVARIRTTLNTMADDPGPYSSEQAARIAQTVEFAVEAICEDKSINVKLHDEYATLLEHKTYLFRIALSRP